ncbi:Fungal lipase-like domain [Dillenia turbinata]|uniref:Fungal lipase-like domain n=1 Tax=Dillenia turbinata TaxID=194707 RepID=A0AAN8V9I2_9MAGN
MASKNEIFSLSGPVHLNAVDWSSYLCRKDTSHRKSIAASLVQGVYVLEKDRQRNRHGPEALSPPWWSSFHFQLVRTLVDDVDLSIFGAIFEFKPPATAFMYNCFGQNAPGFVLAFRGTINKRETMSRDLKLDIKLIFNKLESSSRYRRALQAVHDMVDVGDAANVWLAGHSLGSAIALLAGRHMAKMGSMLETYLFNPPFVAIPIDRIKDQKVKNNLRIAKSTIKAAIALAVKGQHQHQEDQSLVSLSAWIPFLFVNPSDHICSEYIGYFEHRKKMEEMGIGGIERLASQNTWHLLPSVYLTINMSPSPDFKTAHGIHQWWGPNFLGQSQLHQLR